MVIKKSRRIKEDDIKRFGQWIQQETWEDMLNCKSSMSRKYADIVFKKLDEICPEVEIKISKMDGKVTSMALQKLSRQKLREHARHGYSEKFKELTRKQKARIKLENLKEIEKKIENGNAKGMKWMREATRMSSRPGDDTTSTFTLPAHLDANFTPLQSAEAIATYFSSISQEYTAIEEDISASWLEAQKKLNEAGCSHPTITEHTVFENMKSAKKTDSVPGDIPVAILKEFLPELAFPVTAILKEAVTHHSWPEDFKKEYHLPLKKIPLPESEGDLRGIGMTNWASKQLERLVLNWIWPYIQPHVDPDQMGGMPGCSIEHYIIKMVDFILGSMDGDTDAAVLAVPVDYEKAFNRMLHSDILCNLIALNVPKCAVKLIKSYLTQRTMCVRYKGATSSFHRVPGGGPQGGLLTSVLFILQVNKAGSPCRLPALGQRGAHQPVFNQDQETVHHPTTGQVGNSLPVNQPMPGSDQLPVQGPAENPVRGKDVTILPACHMKAKLHKKSFIDDLTLLEKVSLSKLKEKETIIGPLDYHDRFNLTLAPEDGILQHQLEDLKDFTKDHQMILNSNKTKCMPFINSHTKDFMPQLKISDECDKYLEVIYKLKLVGLVVTSNLTWHEHIDYTVGRINKVLWQLTRFKRYGAPQDKLVTFYILKIRSILMFGAVCFHSSLSSELSQKLELQQKRSFAVILGSSYRSYNHARSLLNLPRLDILREKACLKWALKAQANPQHAGLFPLIQSKVNTRHKKKFVEYFCHTTKYYNSAVPHMTRALNTHFSRKSDKIVITTKSGIVISV